MFMLEKHFDMRLADVADMYPATGVQEGTRKAGANTGCTGADEHGSIGAGSS